MPNLYSTGVFFFSDFDINFLEEFHILLKYIFKVLFSYSLQI